MRDRNRDRRLAYAARTDDADEALRSELLRYGSNSFFSTDLRQSRRQFSGLFTIRASLRDDQPLGRTRNGRDEAIAATVTFEM